MMKQTAWHLERAELLLDLASGNGTSNETELLTRRAMAHIQLAQALSAQQMMESTMALQVRTEAVLNETARKVDKM